MEMGEISNGVAGGGGVDKGVSAVAEPTNQTSANNADDEANWTLAQLSHSNNRDDAFSAPDRMRKTSRKNWFYQIIIGRSFSSMETIRAPCLGSSGATLLHCGRGAARAGDASRKIKQRASDLYP
jgi:hypothetical protein